MNGKLPHTRRRDSCVEPVWLAVLRHNGTRRDHAPVANPYTSKDCRAAANPRAVSDRDWTHSPSSCANLGVNVVMCAGNELHPNPDPAMLADPDRCSRIEYASVVDRGTTTDDETYTAHDDLRRYVSVPRHLESTQPIDRRT
jgi:hypothetical protein